MSTVRPTVHTNPSRKRSFPKTRFKPEEFENTGFASGVLVWTWNILKAKLSRKRWSWGYENQVISLSNLPSSTNPQGPVIVLFLNSCGVCVNGKHFMRFQSETSVFKFLWRSVDRKICFQSETSVFKFLRSSVDGTLSESTITHLSVFSHCIHFDFSRTFNELCHHNRMILN